MVRNKIISNEVFLLEKAFTVYGVIIYFIDENDQYLQLHLKRCLYKLAQKRQKL